MNGAKKHPCLCCLTQRQGCFFYAYLRTLTVCSRQSSKNLQHLIKLSFHSHKSLLYLPFKGSKLLLHTLQTIFDRAHIAFHYVDVAFLSRGNTEKHSKMMIHLFGIVCLL